MPFAAQASNANFRSERGGCHESGPGRGIPRPYERHDNVSPPEVCVPELTLARQMWHLIEPVHALLYYAPQVFAAAEALGYATEPRWPSYFAWRAAPLGAVGTHVVSAAFYSFSPEMVEKYVPAAWRVASPEQVIAARS